MKKLNRKELYSLLKIIKSNGNIRKLTRENITYQEIITEIKILTKSDFLTYKNNELILTEKGEIEFSKLEKDNKNTDKNSWIDKEISSKLEEKIEIDFIYLPNQNKLHF